jgi:tetratricopeptide (TPR) repeat protein
MITKKRNQFQNQRICNVLGARFIYFEFIIPCVKISPMDKHEQQKTAESSAVPASSGEAWETTAAEYLYTVKTLLSRGRKMDAFDVLQYAMVKYSAHPLIISYYGWLDAAVEGRYRSGIQACLSAIDLMEKRSLHGEEDNIGAFNAVLYLNLGRAYLAAGKKKEAVSAFTNGQKHNKKNADIRKELNALGTRKKLPVSFLSRSNPLNKYLGMLLHRPQNSPRA